MLELREEARRGFAAVLERRRRAHRARRLDDARLRDRARRLRADRRGRGDHDRPGALRAHRPALRDRRPRRHRRGGRGRDPRGDHAAYAVARDVARAVDDRPAARPASPEAGERARRPRRRRAVGRRDRGRRRRARLLHRVRAEVAVRAGSRRARSTCAIRSSCASSRRRTSRRSRTSSRARSSRATRARGSTRAGSASRPSSASSLPSARIRSGGTRARGDGRALPRAARAARRGRDAAGPLDARLVPAAVGTRPSSSPRCRSDGVIVRELPGPQPRARVVRLVDERGRPAAARRGCA